MRTVRKVKLPVLVNLKVVMVKEMLNLRQIVLPGQLIAGGQEGMDNVYLLSLNVKIIGQNHQYHKLFAIRLEPLLVGLVKKVGPDLAIVKLEIVIVKQTHYPKKIVQLGWLIVDGQEGMARQVFVCLLTLIVFIGQNHFYHPQKKMHFAIQLQAPQVKSVKKVRLPVFANLEIVIVKETPILRQTV